MIQCDDCTKPAVCNYQDVIVRYAIKNGEYGEMKVSDDFIAGVEVNRHFCKKHEAEYLQQQ